MNSPRSHRHALAVLAFAVATTGCSAASPKPVAVTVTVTATPTSQTGSPTASPSDSGLPTDSASPTDAGPTDTAGPSDSGGPTGSPTPGTIPSARAGQPLGLVDAQAQAGQWEENRYEIADRSDVRGMGIPVRYCQDNGSSSLEYRLANRFTTLSMSVAQANSSPASDQQMTVVIIGNGNQLDIETVPFNKVQPIKVSVAGVNALQIHLYLDPKTKNCGVGGGVIGVVEQLVVT